MNNEEFEKYSKELLEHCWKLLFSKSKEYATDQDRLFNFKQPTSLFNTNQAKICLLYDSKHIASMVKIADDIDKGILPSRELLMEKVGDYINYGLLFYGNVLEIINKEKKMSDWFPGGAEWDECNPEEIPKKRERGDCEEPKEYWYIYGNQVLKNECDGVIEDRFKEIGNYFETKEKAELALRKLKAWKRLKDKGFKFKGYTDDSGDLFSCQVIRCSFDYSGNYTESRKDLDLLFSGEDD